MAVTARRWVLGAGIQPVAQAAGGLRTNFGACPAERASDRGLMRAQPVLRRKGLAGAAHAGANQALNIGTRPERQAAFGPGSFDGHDGIRSSGSRMSPTSSTRTLN
jgi:hypothetical protein